MPKNWGLEPADEPSNKFKHRSSTVRPVPRIDESRTHSWKRRFERAQHRPKLDRGFSYKARKNRNAELIREFRKCRTAKSEKLLRVGFPITTLLALYEWNHFGKEPYRPPINFIRRLETMVNRFGVVKNLCGQSPMGIWKGS